MNVIYFGMRNVYLKSLVFGTESSQWQTAWIKVNPRRDESEGQQAP